MSDLREYQKEAVEKLSNGKILWGGVGSGKSRTAIAYYLRREKPRDIYVITTAKKRDSLDWEKEAVRYGIYKQPDATTAGVLTVDSWNNLGKYVSVRDAFFIFDEQRLVGRGAWVRSFLKISKTNHWILLSATPGDVWLDYIPVFIANGFYTNRTEFIREHVVYAPYAKFPKVEKYLGEAKLYRLRDQLLVEMKYSSHLEPVYRDISVSYDKALYKMVWFNRWNPFTQEPVKNPSELFYLMRKVLNSDPSRLTAVRALLQEHPRLIIFYNFDYELEVLRTLSDEIALAEWNGHKHEPIPQGEVWVYLVQYTSGAEGWNCTETNAMCFYSLNYSYRLYRQAQGRIDRLDSPGEKIYYYSLISPSPLDRAIHNSRKSKKSFSETKWMQQANRTSVS